MDLNKFMREIRPNLRPIGIDTCPICGREKQTINKLLNAKTPARCIKCWQEYDGDYEQPEPLVRRPAPSPDLEAKVRELEGRVEGLEREVHDLMNGRKRR